MGKVDTGAHTDFEHSAVQALKQGAAQALQQQHLQRQHRHIVERRDVIENTQIGVFARERPGVEDRGLCHVKRLHAFVGGNSSKPYIIAVPGP